MDWIATLLHRMQDRIKKKNITSIQQNRNLNTMQCVHYQLKNQTKTMKEKTSVRHALHIVQMFKLYFSV